MKKLFMLATAAMLFTGAFAHDGKKGAKKDCCKKDGGKKECCMKGSKTSVAKKS